MNSPKSFNIASRSSTPTTRDTTFFMFFSRGITCDEVVSLVLTANLWSSAAVPSAGIMPSVEKVLGKLSMTG